jgi:hypothetical protein
MGQQSAATRSGFNGPRANRANRVRRFLIDARTWVIPIRRPASQPPASSRPADLQGAHSFAVTDAKERMSTVRSVPFAISELRVAPAGGPARFLPQWLHATR